MTKRDIREVLCVMSVLGASLTSLMVFAASQFRPSQYVEVLPWVFLSYLWGSMTTLAYGFWMTRPKPKRRKTLDEMTSHTVEIELPDDDQTRH